VRSRSRSTSVRQLARAPASSTSVSTALMANTERGKPSMRSPITTAVVSSAPSATPTASRRKSARLT
jgi:hypothetical protein